MRLRFTPPISLRDIAYTQPFFEILILRQLYYINKGRRQATPTFVIISHNGYDEILLFESIISSNACYATSHWRFGQRDDIITVGVENQNIAKLPICGSVRLRLSSPKLKCRCA